MKLNRTILTGAAVLAAGVLMLAGAYATSGVVHAGNQLPCGVTPTPELGAIGPDVAAAAQQLPPCTATPRKVRTHTPTTVPTEEPKTATPVPPTATPTKPAPSSGNEGVQVKPPNTGTGGGAGADVSIWLMVLGAVTVVAGGGAVLAGARRR